MDETITQEVLELDGPNFITTYGNKIVRVLLCYTAFWPTLFLLGKQNLHKIVQS